MWQMFEVTKCVVPGVSLSDWERQSLKIRHCYCIWRVPIYVLPSFYRTLKLAFLTMSVGYQETAGLRPNWIVPALGWPLKDFRTVMDTE